MKGDCVHSGCNRVNVYVEDGINDGVNVVLYPEQISFKMFMRC